MLLLRAPSPGLELVEDSRCVIRAGGFAAFCALNPPSLPLLPCLRRRRRRMSLGTRLLLLHEVAPVFGRVFPNLHHISPVPRAPCAPCAPSHLRFPISIPCFTPCILPPSLLALCGLIPIFSTFGSLSCICHQSNMSFPVSLPSIPKAPLHRLEPWFHHIPTPAFPRDLQGRD